MVRDARPYGMNTAGRWLVILLLALVAGAVLGVVSVWAEPPVYCAETTLAVTTHTGPDGAYAALPRNAAQASSLEAALNSPVFQKLLLAEGGIAGFDGAIAAQVIPSTNLVTLRVTDEDPETALMVLRAALEHHARVAEEIIGTVTAQALRTPELPVSTANSIDGIGRILTAMLLSGVLTLGVLIWSALDRAAQERETARAEKVDLFALGRAAAEQARRLWIVGLALTMLCGGVVTAWCWAADRPCYRAEVSFTVRLAGDGDAYDAQTAERLTKTVPGILTSGLLEQRVREALGTAEIAKISAVAIANIITLRAEAPSAQRAWETVTGALACYPEIGEAVVGPTALHVLDESGVPASPEDPFRPWVCFVNGAALGAAVWAAAVLWLAGRKRTVCK